LRQLFRKLGVQLGQLARLFEDRLLEFLVVQLGKGAGTASLHSLHVELAQLATLHLGGDGGFESRRLSRLC
jgi:hypothetical protein